MAFNATNFPEPHKSLLQLLNRLILEDETTLVRTASSEEQIVQEIKRSLDQGASPFMGVVGNQSDQHPLRIDFVNGRNALRLAKKVFAGYPRLLVDAYEDGGIAAGVDGVDGVVGTPVLPMLSRQFLLAADHQAIRNIDLAQINEVGEPIFLDQLARVTGRSLALTIDLLVHSCKLHLNGESIQNEDKVSSLLTRLYNNMHVAVAALRGNAYAVDSLNACEEFLFHRFLLEAATSARIKSVGGARGLQYLRDVLQTAGAYGRGVDKLLDKASGENGSSLPPLRTSQDGFLLRDLSLLLFRSNEELYIEDHASKWAEDNQARLFVLAIMRRDYKMLRRESEASEESMVEYQRNVSTLFSLDLAVRDFRLDAADDSYREESDSISSMLLAETEVMKSLDAEIDDCIFSLARDLEGQIEDEGGKEAMTRRRDAITHRCDRLKEGRNDDIDDLGVEDFFPTKGNILYGGENVSVGITHDSFVESRKNNADLLRRKYGFRLSAEEFADFDSRLNDYTSNPAIVFERHQNGSNLIALVVKANESKQPLNLPNAQDPGFLVERDTFGRSPIFIAAMLGNCELFTELCRAGVSPTIGDKQGVTPLMAASRVGFTEDVMLEIITNARTNSSNVNQLDHLGYSALGHALLCGRMDAVRSLRKAGANFGHSPKAVPTLRCLLSASVPFSLTDMKEILSYMHSDGLDFVSAFALIPAGANPLIIDVFNTKDYLVLEDLEEWLRNANPNFSLGATVDARTLKELLVSLFINLADSNSTRLPHQCRMLDFLIRKGMSEKSFVSEVVGAQRVSLFLRTVLEAWAEVPKDKREIVESIETPSSNLLRVLAVLGELLQLEHRCFGLRASVYGNEKFGQPTLEVLVRHPIFSALLTSDCLDLFFSSQGVVDSAKQKMLRRAARAAAIQITPAAPEAIGLLKLADPTASVSTLAESVTKELLFKDGRIVKGLNPNSEKGLNSQVRWVNNYLPNLCLNTHGGKPIILIQDNISCVNPNDRVSSLARYLVELKFGNELVAHERNLDRRGTLQYLLLLLQIS